jgi:VWD domain-containing protein
VESCYSPRLRATPFFGTIVATSVLLGQLFSNAASAQQETPTSKASTAPSAAAATKPEIAKTREAWRKSLLQLPQPKPGCYASSFPRVEWTPVACTSPPPYPMPPARGHHSPFQVGNGTDYAAQPTGTISSADGSFVSVSAALTESGLVGNVGSPVSNAYSLQLNTNFFVSTACAGSSNPAICKGWEQFIYENNATAKRVFIQYWLIKYNNPCPGGWNTFTASLNTYCWRNAPGATSLPAGQPVSNLSNMVLTGTVTGSSDQVTMTVGINAATLVGINAVNAAAGWTDAEFNVIGDGGGGQANFGANSTVVVKTTVHNGTLNAPACALEGFTGETNNLTLIGTPSITIQAAPAIEFTQSNVSGGGPGSCATAAGIGDTHLSTFGGLFYDFQASGDFVLAQTGNDFVVQNRQVSGAPNWPNATVNKAVATRMGRTRVAVCTAPSRLEVNGVATQVGDGQTVSLPGGVDIRHTGNVYIVADQSGNSMRAEDNTAYINVTIGLGRWPQNVRGVLANANGQVDKIQARNGPVLTAPFSFAQLYHQYADSWRVLATESLLSVCGKRVETGIPKRPFYADNLDPQIYKRARAVCTAAGVKVKGLLEACTLDVAFFGSETAAKVFVHLRTPRAEGRVVSSRGSDIQRK